jgi:hypothetical protein
LEGILQFTLKDRSPSTLEEAQDLAYQIERNLEFEDYICQVNLSHNNNLWDSSDELVTEPRLPKILKLNSHLPKENGAFPIPIYKMSLFRNLPQKLNLSRTLSHTRRRKSKPPCHKPLSMILLKSFPFLSTK